MFLQDNRKIRKNTKHNKPLKERARKEAWRINQVETTKRKNDFGRFNKLK